MEMEKTQMRIGRAYVLLGFLSNRNMNTPAASNQIEIDSVREQLFQLLLFPLQFLNRRSFWRHSPSVSGRILTRFQNRCHLAVRPLIRINR